jgi:hypothetical protein
MEHSLRSSFVVNGVVQDATFGQAVAADLRIEELVLSNGEAKFLL